MIIEDVSARPGVTASIWGCRNELLGERIRNRKKELKSQKLSKAELHRRLDGQRLGEWSREGVFAGQNIMGKVLMVCRDALRSGTYPAIDLALLRDAKINFFGRVLPFEEVPSFK